MGIKRIRLNHWRALAALMLAAIALLPPAQPVYAQDPATGATPQPGFRTIDTPDGIAVQWTTAGASSLEAVQAVLPSQEYQGFTLPMQAITLKIVGGPDAGVLQIRQLQSIELPPGTLAPNPVDAEPLIIDATTSIQPLLEAPQLPTAPAFIASSGTENGEWIVVLALSPVYAENGVPRLATALEAVVSGSVRAATPEEITAQMSAADAAAPDALYTGPEAVVDPALVAAPDALDNPDVTSSMVKLVVTNPGVQRVALASLTAANGAWTAATLPNARLTFKNTLIPIQIVGSELRFYAASVGDRWNSTDAYILGIESDAAKRSPKLGTRNVTLPVAAADAAEIEATSTAIDRATWIVNKTYEAKYPGQEADFYFAAKLSRKAGAPAQDFSVDLMAAGRRPSNQLPLASGKQAFTLNLVRVVAESHGTVVPVAVTVPGANAKNADVDFTGVASKQVKFEFSPVSGSTLKLTLRSGNIAQAVLLDSIAFERAVLLNMASKGAVFAGAAGQTTYRWSSVPKVGGAIVLWDVTNPAAPVALNGAGDGGFVDSQAARSYAVAGDGSTFTPAVKGYNPLGGGGIAPAHLLYIVPDMSYAGALTPLVNLRTSQNCTSTAKCVVTIVDATRIYDRYSGGQIAPEAIRLFLQDAYFAFAAKPIGSPRLLSAVLAGDGTWDPKNIEAKKSNPALIPPYMRDGIDVTYGEVPCDRCYANLIGYNGVRCADPHTCDSQNLPGTTFSPEIWIGRLPAKSVAELQAYVAKLYGYETATDNAPWRGRTIYVADNYMKGEPGPNPIRDGAGDFAATVDSIWTLNPAKKSSWSASRVYYDPFPGAQNPTTYGQPWRFSDPKGAWQQVISALNEGAGVFVYYGHATPWTMARYDLPTAWRFALIENTDADYLFNDKRFFMQLSMTCLSSQFARPADSGMTLDEQFLLDNNGGSIAAWGPAGYGVPTAHDLLAKGYFRKLYATSTPQTIGALTSAGFLELSSKNIGHYDMLRTFTLLGDPMTRIRTGPAVYPTYLPVTRR